MPDPMLALQDVHVRYGNIRALQGVSLTVAPGELVALIGSNGAGKTTTLRTISGLLRPSRGHDHVRGRRHHPRADRPDRRARHLALSRGSADLRPPDRAREPAPRRRVAGRQAGRGRGPRDGARAVPAAQGADRPGRRDAVRRRAADAGDRPGADEPAAPAAARRAVAGPRAADGRADLRDHRRAQGARAGRSCWSSRTSTTRSTSPTAPTSWRPGRITLEGPADVLRHEPDGRAVVPRRRRGVGVSDYVIQQVVNALSRGQPVRADGRRPGDGLRDPAADQLRPRRRDDDRGLHRRLLPRRRDPARGGDPDHGRRHGRGRPADGADRLPAAARRARTSRCCCRRSRSARSSRTGRC